MTAPAIGPAPGYPATRRRGSGDYTLNACAGGYRHRGKKPTAMLATFDEAGRFVEFVPVAYRPEASS